MNKNGETEKLSELDETTMAVKRYAEQEEVSVATAAMILLLHELRCVHSHFDRQLEVNNARQG